MYIYMYIKISTHTHTGRSSIGRAQSSGRNSYMQKWSQLVYAKVCACRDMCKTLCVRVTIRAEKNCTYL